MDFPVAQTRAEFLILDEHAAKSVVVWSYRFNVDSRYIIYSGDHFNFIQHFAATGCSGSDWWRVERERG